MNSFSSRRRRRTTSTAILISNRNPESYDLDFGLRSRNSLQLNPAVFQKVKLKIGLKKKHSIRVILVTLLLMFILSCMLFFKYFNFESISNGIDPLFSDIDLKEMREVRKQLMEARSRGIAPIQSDLDKQKYTVRINTWRRNDILPVSVRHFQSCSNVAQVQIVWCDEENEPPDEILNMENDVRVGLAPVTIERHILNSLNERFHLIHNAPTLAILSVDDDVLRPCSALDAGFHRWKKHPDRMVGYDFRHYSEAPFESAGLNKFRKNSWLDQNVKWKYSQKTTTLRSNLYSMSLTRFCFIHKDYLTLYIDFAPRRVRDTVDKYMNCEDIGMSFFVSALTHGKVPLLSDYWSILSLVKLQTSSKISDGKDHLQIRDECVNKFGLLMGLKDGYEYISHGNIKDWILAPQKIMHSNTKRMFGIGANTDDAPFLDINMTEISSLREAIKDIGMLDPDPG